MGAVSFLRIDGNEKHISKFSSECFRYTGVNVPAAYTNAGITWGLFIDGQMKGGFVIASGTLMRCPSIIPSNSLTDSEFLKRFSRQDWAEVNQAWLSDEIKNYAVSMRFWLKIRKELLRTGHTVVFMPWVMSNKGLDRFYREFATEVIYQGPPANAVGHNVTLCVGCATSSAIRWKTLKHFPQYLRKILTAKPRQPKLSVQTAEVV